VKISRIVAKNFRTLEDIDIQLTGYYCPVSGKNNAGKSCLIRVINYFLFDNDYSPYFRDSNDVIFTRDKTQWSAADSINIGLHLTLSRLDDSEMFFFVEKFSGKDLSGVDEITLQVSREITKDSRGASSRILDHIDFDEKTSLEILRKLQSSSNAIVHNSTRPRNSVYYGEEGIIELLEVHLSEDDRKKIRESEKALQTRVRQVARRHKEALSELLGRLSDNYDVELTTPTRSYRDMFPLLVTLTDKQVEVPLRDWGSGTQNRTHILTSILQAARIRSSNNPESRTTPVVVIEEPESFLHPSGQAEFGRVLEALAGELRIQIICTTHSPYMLNQKTPSDNVLIERREYRKKLKNSYRVDTTGDQWMAPFSQILGIVPPEFEAWRAVMGTHRGKVIFVEGAIDVEYFEHFKDNYPSIYAVSSDVEVQEYGGKDSLKNTQLLQFMIGKFERVFITFDLDASSEVVRSLSRIDLKEGEDYSAIGENNPGAQCIEGLLPESVHSSVYASSPHLVQALASADSNAKKSAKADLKRRLLTEFKSRTFDEKDLAKFKSLFKVVAKGVG
jgi:predicted ATP-dependent endonuclease of OLD family